LDEPEERKGRGAGEDWSLIRKILRKGSGNREPMREGRVEK